MKIVATIARYLLGVMFLVFGSNAFLHFIPMPPPPPGTFGQYAGLLAVSGYVYVIGFFQAVPALLLLANRFVPLAVTLLGPMIFNILVVHILMAPGSIGLGVIAAILWFLVFWSVFPALKGIFQARVAD
jgi:putative oxidoreductase